MMTSKPPKEACSFLREVDGEGDQDERGGVGGREIGEREKGETAE